jgi:hypothetical protein
MSERATTLGAALLALLLFASLMFGGQERSAPPPSRPRSQDTGPAGLLGAYRWLEAAGVPVLRLRQRYTDLDALVPAPTGNLLVIVEPMRLAVRPTERAALLQFLERGNQLLLLGSFAQRIGWGENGASGELFETLGLRRYWATEDRDEDRVIGPALAAAAQSGGMCDSDAVTHGTISGPLRRLRPPPENALHPVLAGVTEVAVKAAPAGGSTYRGVGHASSDRLSYPVLCDPQLRAPVLTALRAGNGRVWASDYSELFSNDDLARADNARLLGNLVRHALGARGAVIFDDMHQGDSVLYDPAAFLRDPRLRATLGFALALWLAWLLSASNRFASPRTLPARASGLSFVRSVGRFYARHLKAGEAQAGLFRHFFNRARAR